MVGRECLSVRSNGKAGWLADRLVFGFGVAVERCDSSCLVEAFTGQRAGWISKPTTWRTGELARWMTSERARKQGSGNWRQ